VILTPSGVTLEYLVGGNSGSMTFNSRPHTFESVSLNSELHT